ncbi:hypothetical protein ACX8XP_02890 [Calditrichota bacterium LG25]
MNPLKSIVWCLLLVALVAAQTREELRRALAECEADLQISLHKIETLTRALETTDELIQKKEQALDSLLANLQRQIETQALIRAKLQSNADTLQLMVSDYQQKLDEVADLYRKELKKSSRPWIFTRQGLQGFTTGILIGGALGLIYGLML